MIRRFVRIFNVNLRVQNVGTLQTLAFHATQTIHTCLTIPVMNRAPTRHTPTTQLAINVT